MIFKFCPDFFRHTEKCLDKKAQVIFNIMTCKIGNKQLQYTYLYNISRSKRNLAMKFGQSTDYKTWEIFFLKIMQKMR